MQTEFANHKEIDNQKFIKLVNYIKFTKNIKSDVEISDTIGMDKASFSLLLNNKRKASEKKYQLLLSEFDITEEEIEQQIVTINEPQEPYHVKRLKNKIEKTVHTAPLVPVKAQAGYTSAYDQTDYINTLEQYAIPPGVTYHGAIWRYWEIEGESMMPTFRNRDIILTSQVHQMDWDDLRNFYIYVIVTQDHVFVKRVFRKSDSEWVLISDNEDNGYEQFAIDPKTVNEVWVFRRHIDSQAPAPKMFEIKI